MSSVGSFLFGERGSPGRVVDTTPEIFRDLRAPVASGIQEQFQNPATWGGPFAAALGSQEQQILDMLGAGPSTLPIAQQALTQAASGAFLDPASNPFLQASIEMAQRPIMELFGDQTQANRAQFTMAGQRIQPGASSPFEMAQARLSGDVASALGDVSTRLLSENLGRERQLQQQAALSLPAQEMEVMMNTLQAQALPRLIEQMGIDRGLQEFQRLQQQILQALQIGGGLSVPSPVSIPGTSATPGFLHAVAGGIGQGMGNPLGTAIAGLPIFGR